jgi:serine/threonine protein kinase
MSPRPDCPGEPTLYAFAAGRLDVAAARAVRLHLDGCAACRARLREAEVASGSAEPTSDAAASPSSAGPAAPTVPAAEERPPEDPDPLVGITCLSPSSNPQALGRIGAYDVLSVLGRGGMGVVLRAFDTSLHRTVAIKLLSPHLAASRKAHRRFLREARAAAGINHPNVVTIHAVEEQDGMPYLVMEYVPGQTLRQRIHDGGPFDLPSLLRIGAQVAAGLVAAHRHGVIHRDIKPANIMLEDGIERAKITDFGLALVALDVAELTSADNVLGTPAYMAPEQVAGRRVDPRADLFSLGCVLYAMVSGGSPFHGAHALDIARKVTDFVPPPLHEQYPEVPRVFSDTVARLLEKDPDRRSPSADEVHEVLVGYLARAQQGGSLESLAGPGRAEPVPRRRWRYFAVAALALLALLVGTAGFWLGRREGPVSGSGPDSSQADDPSLPPPQPGEVLTVAKTGGARFRDLREALARAGPGSTIRILDQATYTGPFLFDDAERLHDVTVESPNHAVLQLANSDKPVVYVGDTPGVVLRGMHIRSGDPQHCISVQGNCEGLTVEDVRLTQPPQCPFAALVLWRGSRGSAARPVVLRHLDVQSGRLGVAILGDDGNPADWVRVEDSRFTGPGRHVSLEVAVRDVRVTGNLFLQGKRGVSLVLTRPGQTQRLSITRNTFFGTAEWLGLAESELGQSDVTIANNLILQADALQLAGQDLSRVADRWFRNNWWEPGPTADPARVRQVAELRPEVKLLSRDPADPNFLRPAAGTMPADYVGALPPAGTDRPPDEHP